MKGMRLTIKADSPVAAEITKMIGEAVIFGRRFTMADDGSIRSSNIISSDGDIRYELTVRKTGVVDVYWDEEP